MKTYTVEVTKTIVVTVEAADWPTACEEIQNSFRFGEYDKSWVNAEPQFELLDVEEN